MSTITDTDRKLDLLDNQTLSVTDSELEFWVDDVNGSDRNDGSQSAPFKTLSRAFSEVPYVVAHDCQITVAPHGSGAYAWDTVDRAFVGTAKLFVRFTEFNEIVSSSPAQSGSSNAKVVTSGGLTEDEYVGKTIEILTGSAAGDRRTIRDNTTTEISTCAYFSADVAEDDLYRIVEPDSGNAVTPPGPFTPMVAGPRPRDLDPMETDRTSGVTLINCFIEPESQDLTYTSGGRLTLVGTETKYGGSPPFIRSHNTGELLLGCGAWDELRTPWTSAGTEWLGWGYNFSDNRPVWIKKGGLVLGYFTAERYAVFDGVHLLSGRVYAGSLRCTPAVDIVRTSPCIVSLGPQGGGSVPAFSAYSIVTNTLATAAVLSEGRHAYVWLGDNVRIDSADVCIKATDGGEVLVYADWHLDDGTDGVVAVGRGVVTFASTKPPSTISLSGEEVKVGNTPETATFAGDLGSAGDFVVDTTADDGSIVQSRLG